MKRARLAMLLPVAGLLSLLAPATTAQAATDQATTAYTCYPKTPAAFDVTVSTVVSKQTTTTIIIVHSTSGLPVSGWAG